MPLYSHSRLNSYTNCPRKFLWRYVWNVAPSVEGVEAFTGKRVHESLEEIYRRVVRGEEPPPLPSVLSRFRERWDRAWSDGIRIVADQTPSWYRARGIACLEGYYARHHPFRSGTTVGIEQAFEFPLQPGSRYRIRGFLDRVDLGPDGVLEVHDYKTGKRTPSARELGADLQVGLYEMAARALYPEHRRVRMVWHYLRSRRQHRMPERGPSELAALRRGVSRQIDAIEERVGSYTASLDHAAARTLVAAGRAKLPSVPRAGRQETHLFPARVGPLCRWCSFLDWCPDGARHAGRPFRPPDPPPDPPPPPRPQDPRQLGLF